MTTKVVLIGAGGHSKVIQDIVNANDDLKLCAVLDHHFKSRKVKDGITFAGMDMIADFVKEGCRFCIAIGNNKVRQKLMLEFNIPLDRYIALIHSTAVISPSALVGLGTVVMPNTVINADTIIGNHRIVNSCAVIEHDNRLGDFVHVSSNATLAGTVIVGEGTHVGSGATVISWKKIGDGVLILGSVDLILCDRNKIRSINIKHFRKLADVTSGVTSRSADLQY